MGQLVKGQREYVGGRGRQGQRGAWDAGVCREGKEG